VSFTKGCFTGQELVARLDARGSKVARHLWGLMIADDDDADAADTAAQWRPSDAASLVGSAVFSADGENEVGHLSSVAWSPGSRGIVALATLHRRVEPPEAVLVARELPDGSTGHLRAEACPLPLVGS
jgi:folate-binding Fe-S cluster repair protein YgfZ